MKFDSFDVGDHVVVQRCFTTEDYLSFEKFNINSNELRKQGTGRSTTESGPLVVPMQMLTSPLYAISEMFFPGVQSICLRQNVHSIAPVFVNDQISYSARVRSIKETERVLILSVIALRGLDVVLEGDISLQSPLEQWSSQSQHVALKPPTALITGASGSIGSSIALKLARHGWGLWLHGRTLNQELKDLVAKCVALGSDAKSVVGELTSPNEVRGVAESVASDLSLTALIHVACPNAHAGLSSLVAVNFEALRQLSKAVLPNALRHQSGAIVAIGPANMDGLPWDWDDYIAAKATVIAYTNSINHRYEKYGVRGLIVAPGFVNTRHSEDLIGEVDDVLLPEEVANEVYNALITKENHQYFRIDANSRDAGRWGYTPKVMTSEAVQSALHSRSQFQPVSDVSGDLKLEDNVRRLLKLPQSMSLEKAGLGRTPGWDSLRHIELLLGLEHIYDIKFTSTEIERTRDFVTLEKICSRKIRA